VIRTISDYVRTGQIRIFQIMTSGYQVMSRKVKFGQPMVRSGQVRSDQVRFGHVKSGQIRSRPSLVNSCHVRLSQGQVTSGQIR